MIVKKVCGNLSNKKMIGISVVIFVIGIIFPIGFLLGFIAEKVAFPIMFIWLGCLQIFNGFVFGRINKHIKLVSILFGLLFILFAIIIVIPKYYF